MGERRAATAGLPWAAWASAMARSSWSWVAGPPAALTRLTGPARGVAAPCAVARAPHVGCCPAGSLDCVPPSRPGGRGGASRSLSPGGVPRELGGLRRGISRRRGRGPDALAARVRCRPRPPLVRAPCPADARDPGPGGMRYPARHLTIVRCRPRWRPAAGGRRDAIPVARRPTPGHPDVGVVRVAVTCTFTAMARSGRRPGTGGLRGTGRDRAGMARPGWSQ